jgi:dTDP-4-dehydrorhamnose reductase
MKIIITGSNGLVGQKISSLLALETDYEVLMVSIEKENYQTGLRFTYQQLDLANRKETKEIILSFKPNVIINTVAFTNVDECENQREYAWRLNVDVVKNLIICAKVYDIKIIHFSSDYIFDGKNGPYSEDSIPNPISYYGKTKLASENALRESGIKYCIIRTMVLYGYAKIVRENFVLWIIKSLNNNQSINVVTDQTGNPTLVDDIGYGIIKIIKGNRTGIYNMCGSQLMSRYDFAKKVAEVFSLNTNLIKPVSSDYINQSANRPLKSGLICFKTENEMGIKFLNPTQGLNVLKKQIELEGFLNKF